MPIARFYCPAPLSAHTRIALPKALAHHATRVLRLQAGATIVLFDGTGGEYPAMLETEGSALWARISEHDPIERELDGRVTLVQGIASGDKMDWIIEKAVELGVARFIPIAAERSVLRLSGERLEKRILRWRAIAQSASEQCGRNRLMHIELPARLDECLPRLCPPGAALLCHPEADTTLAQALAARPAQLALLIGPEGGWSEDEQAQARRHAVQAVAFGPRVLRTETAGIALLAASSALLGWR